LTTFTWREIAKICSELRNFSAKKLLFNKIYPQLERGIAPPQIPPLRSSNYPPPTFQQALTPLDVFRAAMQVQLRVISKQVKSDTVSVNNVRKVSHVQHEQYWAK